MSIKRAIYLLNIINERFVEIEPPDDGWSDLNKSCIINNIGMAKTGEFGKFFFTEEGHINYMASGMSVIGLKSYHPSLLEMLIKQLENKARHYIANNLRFIKAPNLYHLLMVFYDLY